MKIVAVTSCIAGLAHTPMAGKALEKAGEKLGYDIKVEQQGAMGQINAISKKEAQEADFVLIASDQTISGMDRFEGKKVIKVKIGVVIKSAEQVIEKCIESLKK